MTAPHAPKATPTPTPTPRARTHTHTHTHTDTHTHTRTRARTSLFGASFSVMSSFATSALSQSMAGRYRSVGLLGGL
jgi:hypothetical protein